MNIPNPINSPIALFQYLFILAILYIGVKQYILARKGIQVNKFFVIPIGALCLITGFIGMFVHIKMAFNAIEVAGNISPQIVASGIKDGYDYPILGFLGLALSYAFRFINSRMILPLPDTDLEN